MTQRPDQPGLPGVFLERRTYRRRRMMDAARMAPVLALMLWLIPLFWPQTGAETVTSAAALSYIFGVWAGFIVLSLVLSRLLAKDADEPPDPET